jgi:hypothetical protein
MFVHSLVFLWVSRLQLAIENVEQFRPNVFEYVHHIGRSVPDEIEVLE